LAPESVWTVEKRRIFDRGKGNVMLAIQEKAFDLGMVFFCE
jgi:hypothetical protein